MNEFFGFTTILVENNKKELYLRSIIIAVRFFLTTEFHGVLKKLCETLHLDFFNHKVARSISQSFTKKLA